MITFAVLSDLSEEDAYSISNSSIFVANLLLTNTYAEFNEVNISTICEIRQELPRKELIQHTPT